MTSGIQLAVFDLGRVLVRICDDWLHACRVAGVAAPSGAIDAAAGARLHELVCRVEVGGVEHEAFCREAGPVLGLAPADVSKLWDAYTLGPYPGALELLQSLQSLDVRTACLSNTNVNHWRILGDPTGHSYFPFDLLHHAFASHLLGLRKPDDAIYEHVQRATGARGGAVVFFDDVPENVDSAARRGWRTYRIDPVPDDPISQIRAAFRRNGIAL